MDNDYQTYKKIFNNIKDALFLIDIASEKEFFYELLNPVYEVLIGLKTSQIKGKSPKKLLGAKKGAKVEQRLKECLAKKKAVSYQEQFNFEEDDRVWLTKLSPVIIDGEVTKIIGSSKDITGLKQKEKEIEHISFHDQLTGLHNRRFYNEKVKELNSSINMPLTIIIGDVNGLKMTNDFFGHKIGDELLKITAEILVKASAAEDIVVRWGGDEFCIVAPQTTYFEGEKKVSQINELADRYAFDKVPISISFGLATKKNVEENLDLVFNSAEDEMYESKRKEKRVFNHNFLQSLLKQLELKNKCVIDHTKRMINLAIKFADKYNFSKENKNLLIKAIKLHDIGKLALEQNHQVKKLEDFKKHVQYSYKIANNFKSLNLIAPDIIHHHEYWNGSGYPEGLRQDEIPWFSRIIAVIDLFDALISNDVNHDLIFSDSNDYLNKEEALKKIGTYSGKYLDPQVVKMFNDLEL
ncbi:MAG: diguanylate cyclase [Bacillota bacterium]